MNHFCPPNDPYGDLAESFWIEENTVSPIHLFHYCPTQSALNISQSGKIWASAFECMNDKREFQYGIEIAIGEIEKSILRLPVTKKDIIIDNWRKFLVNEKKNPRLRPYTLSFSDISNNKHLWKHYADNHRGFSIEFQNSLKTRGLLNGCFVKMLYDEKAAKSKLKKRLMNIEDHFNCCDICLKEQLTNIFYSYLQTIFLSSISLKHKKWAPEKEWRMVFFGAPSRSPNSCHGDIKFRTRNFQLVDYLEIDLCKAGLKLNSLIVGKGLDDSSKNSLQLFKNKIQIK